MGQESNDISRSTASYPRVNQFHIALTVVHGIKSSRLIRIGKASGTVIVSIQCLTSCDF